VKYVKLEFEIAQSVMKIKLVDNVILLTGHLQLVKSANPSFKTVTLILQNIKSEPNGRMKICSISLFINVQSVQMVITGTTKKVTLETVQLNAQKFMIDVLHVT